MFETLYTFADRLLGLGLQAHELLFRHMAWRTLIVFGLAVTLARLGARRLLSHNAGFDIMVAIILGSILSRGVNGDAAFLPTLGASALLVGLHLVLAILTFRWHRLSLFVKGRPHTLVRHGVLDRKEMARTKITDDDLDENLRLHGGVAGTDDVAEARLERNGAVSVVTARPQTDTEGSVAAR